MKTFQQKKEELAKLNDKLGKAKIAIFTSFAQEGSKGLNVGDLRTLKADLKKVNSEYLVGKKTLLDRALGQRLEFSGQRLVNVFDYVGSLGIAFGYGDEQLVAKSVYNFARKNPALKYFGAIQAGKFMNFEQLTEFAKLPSKDIMIARLLGMMKYPLSALANVLDQVVKQRIKS